MATRDREFGRWLKRSRTARFRTQAEALAVMAAEGLHISPSEYAQWESGSRVPRDNNPKKVQLYKFFGSEPDYAEEVPDLATALGALAVELRRWRTEREHLAELEATVIALTHRVDALQESAAPGEPGSQQQRRRGAQQDQ
jgi:transcriptional regulator with XRE-family HTH domain